MTILVVLVLGLVAAGCGGGDEEASDTQTVATDTVGTDEATDETTTDDTDTDTGDIDDLGVFGSGECAELIGASAALSQAFGSAGTPGDDVDEVQAFFDEFVDDAPEEIREDFQVLADAYSAYADVLADVQVEPGQVPDAETLQKLQEAIASIDQQEVSEASLRISAWATENCQG
jgi:ABC-type glycerol-3-phosphate transport system substrate-binding protein